jgi:L-fuconolactonase
MKMKLPSFAAAALTLLFAGGPVACAGEKPPLPKVKHMIDTHIHIFDTEREGGVPWPQEEDTILYRPHLPEEFKRVSRPSGLTGVVVVEASKYLKDNDWVLDLVAEDEFFVALVGRVLLDREDFEEQLVKLAQDRRFVGIRTHLSPEMAAVKEVSPLLLKNLRVLAKHKIALDVLCGDGGPDSVAKIDQLAGMVPDLHIVVNHVFGYRIDGSAAAAEWVAAVEKLAARRNVWCKVSGLYQRSIPQPAPVDIEHYRPVIDVLWKNLGPERLVFGSNWPCTRRVGDFDGYVRMVNSYFSEKGQDACERYFWENATEAYRLRVK